ncbi:unnamed protein product, partial [Meganyctiphanes norvegica]
VMTGMWYASGLPPRGPSPSHLAAASRYVATISQDAAHHDEERGVGGLGPGRGEAAAAMTGSYSGSDREEEDAVTGSYSGSERGEPPGGPVTGSYSGPPDRGDMVAVPVPVPVRTPEYYTINDEPRWEEFIKQDREESCRCCYSIGIRCCLGVYFIFHPVSLAVLSTVGGFVFLMPGSPQELVGGIPALNVMLLVSGSILTILQAYGNVKKIHKLLLLYLLFQIVISFIAVYIIWHGLPFQFTLFIMLNFISMVIMIAWKKEDFSDMNPCLVWTLKILGILALGGALLAIIADGRLANF